MTTFEKLQYIIENTKAGFSLEINRHKNYYDKIEGEVARYVVEDDLDPLIGDEIIKRDTLVDLHCYKDTPVGFYRAIHYSLEEAINRMYETYKADV